MPGGDPGQQGSNTPLESYAQLSASQANPFVRTSQGIEPLPADLLVKRPPNQEGTAGPTRTPRKVQEKPYQAPHIKNKEQAMTLAEKLAAKKKCQETAPPPTISLVDDDSETDTAGDKKAELGTLE